jgi:hypothetical protein
MEQSMNGFRKMQQRLRAEGWYVGWNLPCCQSCAWADLPYEFEDGTEIDFSKVLFNHSQDCEVDLEGDDCPACDGKGGDESEDGEWFDCERCDGEGYVFKAYDGDRADLDESVHGFTCLTPEAQHHSTFCFDGDKEGVKNLKAILPIIEECGCSWTWNQKGDQRIEISWDNK